MVVATEEKTDTKKKKGDLDMATALRDWRWGLQYRRKFFAAAEEDMEFALGKQWDDDDVTELENAGVMPVTVNEVAPILQLLWGIESQNRSDIRAYPEGKEDSVEAEIVTRLLKNAIGKQAEADYKITEMFFDGNACGESWLEPWLDNTEDLIISQYRTRKSEYYQFSWDPYAKEYDLSDATFFDKFTCDLTKDQILQIYPDAEDLLKNASNGKLPTSDVGGKVDALGSHEQPLEYGEKQKGGSADPFSWAREGIANFDLLEHFYKKYVDRWYVIDQRANLVKEADGKEEAENYARIANERDPDGAQVAVAVRKKVPEIWMMAMTGGVDKPLHDGRAWSYPAWKSWPYMPYFAQRSTAKLKESSRDLAIQGITRRIKSLNREKNKRRTQELRHLNQSANSGWLTPENAWVNRDDVENYGSASGVNLEYKQEIGKPERIYPMALSQGHAQLAQESSDDIKRASGVNPDLLAAQEGGTDSGRAIALRQKQGLVMVQPYLDNYTRTKKIYTKFTMSQLPELFTIERAMRVCGDAFIAENFQKPVMVPLIDPKTGQPVIDPRTQQPALAPQIDPMTGQPVMETDMAAATEMFKKVINDKELMLYDVAIGEVVSKETVQYVNFLLLSEMMGQGVPIPPDVMVDESTLPQASKEKIKKALQAQLAAAATKPKK